MMFIVLHYHDAGTSPNEEIRVNVDLIRSYGSIPGESDMNSVIYFDHLHDLCVHEFPDEIDKLINAPVLMMPNSDNKHFQKHGGTNDQFLANGL